MIFCSTLLEISYSIILVSIVMSSSVGCGSNLPPIVNSASDINALPVDQHAVRARTIHDADVSSFSRLQHITTLDFLGGWKGHELLLSDGGLAELAALHLPKLDTFNLGYSDKITDNGIANISHIETLKRLRIIACSHITGICLQYLSRLKNLEFLDLSGNTGITDKDLQALVDMKGMQLLVLNGCPNITTAGIEELQTKMPACHMGKDDRAWQYENE